MITSLREARDRAKPGEYIMLLRGQRYDSDSRYIVVTDEERMKLSSGWITWERKD